jgi:hypothetical protein
MAAPGIPCDIATASYCSENGVCSPAFPVCNNECETAMDCAQIDAPCQICPDGTTQCPSVECQMGICVSSYPSCTSMCMSDADCPAILAPCQMCPDGTTSCPQTECVNGRCSSGWPGCGGSDPCAGVECGEPCNPCVGMDCPVADVAFLCNADGKCAAEAPNCLGECTTEMDCPQLELCYMCADGSCGTMECLNGACGWSCPPGPEPECMSAMDCVTDTVCRVCPDMSCAVVECLRNECVSVCGL